MNSQPFVQSRSLANGFPHRRVEREGSTRSENRVQSVKTNTRRMPNTAVSGKVESLDVFSRDRLVYLATCKIGHLVEVHLKDGSVYAGIFHAANVEKDFGIILKMPFLIREGTSSGQDSCSESFSEPPKTCVIPADEIVQVTAKDLAISKDGLTDAFQCEKQRELLTDSSISQTCRVDLEKELKPWVPDEGFPECPELENVFNVPWNRGWDQFEVNETLFGVKSTFNEELYTTKLERGPRTRELEEQAFRIAREIESESTRDMHLAEERGLVNEKFDVDEETKYSSVHRVGGFDDSGYEDEEDILLDSRNDLTFGDLSASDNKNLAPSGGKCHEESWDNGPSSQKDAGVDQCCSISDEHAREHLYEQPSKDLLAPASDIRTENQLGEQRNSSSLDLKNHRPSEESVSGLGDSQSSLDGKEDTNKARKYNGLMFSDPSGPPPTTAEKQSSFFGRQAGQTSGKAKTESSSGRPSSSASASSESARPASASSRPGLTPSSSFGSLSSEKSTLNPNAKEFKLNPNAKSFKPSQSSVRPPSSIAGGSFYYPTGVSAVPPMSGMPVGYGVGPAFGGPQPVMYSPQLHTVQTPQAFFPPNGPQYPQQMMMNQPRQFMYMPPYQPEMAYKGREY